ncbi:MAG: PEGA domain-containing protein, partial [Deltaproteobacteria bacterium]|nr:PEGA domain-containing protein [Deltaproteobacteria bacterium]
PGVPASEGRASEQAAALKAEGDRAMQSLRYADALEAYRGAAKLAPSPALRYNEGRALQALGRYPEALDALRAFALEAPAELRAKVPGLDALLADLQARVGTLELLTAPPGAVVVVRGAVVGRTPLARPIALNSGPAVVEITLAGYAPFRSEVTLRGGGALRLPVELVPLSNRGLLRVESPVSGARVFVDGRAVGTVPTELWLPAGAHEVVLRREGYDEAESRASITAGERRSLRIDLAETTPITARWWFWAGIGVTVAGGAALTAALLTERSPDEGSIPPGKLATALTFE